MATCVGSWATLTTFGCKWRKFTSMGSAARRRSASLSVLRSAGTVVRQTAPRSVSTCATAASQPAASATVVSPARSRSSKRSRSGSGASANGL